MWTVYVRDHCHDCDRVLAWLDEHGIAYKTKDIDRSGGTTSQRFFIAPALCRRTELVAYGIDIISYFEGNAR